MRFAIDDMLGVFEPLTGSEISKNDESSAELENRLEKQRDARFESMLSQIPAYVASLAGTQGQIEAQIFIRYEHGDHSDFAAMYSNGEILSEHHYSNAARDAKSLEIWKAANQGQTRFYPNLKWYTTPFRPKPADWKRHEPHRYATFITVPILGEDNLPWGLLTINASRPGVLTQVDVEVVELFALMIQSAGLITPSFQGEKDYETMFTGRKRRCTHGSTS